MPRFTGGRIVRPLVIVRVATVVVVAAGTARRYFADLIRLARMKCREVESLSRARHQRKEKQRDPAEGFGMMPKHDATFEHRE